MEGTKKLALWVNLSGLLLKKQNTREEKTRVMINVQLGNTILNSILKFLVNVQLKEFARNDY